MKQGIVFLDICNTLANVNAQIERMTNCKRPKGLYFHPCVCEEWFAKHLDVFRDCEALPGAVEGVQALSKRFDIVYLSARPECARKITVDWLEKEGFPRAGLVLTANKVDAAKEIMQFGHFQAVFAIDDAPHEIEAYRRAGIPVCVYRTDYNCHMGHTFKWK